MSIQVYWANFQCTYAFPATHSLGVALYNGGINVVNTVFTVHAFSALSTRVLEGSFVEALGWPQWAGALLFAAGIYVELSSESTRARWARDPKNKGEVCDAGLNGVVRHPNYLGYTLWRTGVALASVRALSRSLHLNDIG